MSTGISRAPSPRAEVLDFLGTSYEHLVGENPFLPADENSLECYYTPPSHEGSDSESSKNVRLNTKGIEVRRYTCLGNTTLTTGARKFKALPTHHEEVQPKSASRTRKTKKLFQCSDCDFATIYPRNLRRHRHKHLETKRLECDQCSFRTNREDSLEDHQRTHSGAKPYVCSECSYRSAYRVNRNRHFRTHHEAQTRI